MQRKLLKENKFKQKLFKSLKVSSFNGSVIETVTAIQNRKKTYPWQSRCPLRTSFSFIIYDGRCAVLQIQGILVSPQIIDFGKARRYSLQSPANAIMIGSTSVDYLFTPVAHPGETQYTTEHNNCTLKGWHGNTRIMQGYTEISFVKRTWHTRSSGEIIQLPGIVLRLSISIPDEFLEISF